MLAVLSLLTACHSKSENVTLKPKAAAIFIISNVSTQPILLDHVRGANPGVGAGWESRLLPGNYSALLVSHKGFELSCKPLSCLNAVSIKEKPLKLDRGENYWVAEDKSCHNLIKKIRKRGFKIKKVCTA